MKKASVCLILAPWMMAVNECGGEDVKDRYLSCGTFYETTGDNLGQGSYSDSTADSGSQCGCSKDRVVSDYVTFDVFEVGGFLVDNYNPPNSVAISLMSDIEGPAKTPVLGGSPAYSGWDWFVEYTNFMPNSKVNVQGSWTSHLSIIDSSGSEIVDDTSTSQNRCADNYQSGYWYSLGSSVTASGGMGWEKPGGGAWGGDVTFFTHPDQLSRADGMVKASMVLASGSPLINGVEISSLTMSDIGSMKGIEIDGVYYDLTVSSPSLSSTIGFDAEVYLDPDPTVTSWAPPVFQAFGNSSSSDDFEAPSEGYVLPIWLTQAVIGIQQPLVVQLTTTAAGEQVLMLTAVGSGMTRGTRLESDGSFSRSSSVDGWSISGTATETSSGLKIADLTVSRWGVPIPVPPNHILSPVPSEM